MCVLLRVTSLVDALYCSQERCLDQVDCASYKRVESNRFYTLRPGCELTTYWLLGHGQYTQLCRYVMIVGLLSLTAV
jgi:hypothetical protein